MRFCLCLLTIAMAALSAADPATGTITLRGKLAIREGRPATIETTDHKKVTLTGDASTNKVIADPRLNGFEVDVKGHFTGPKAFLIDPIHGHSMLVHKDGGLKMVSYWCDNCSIRYTTPGPCACCQKETTLELRDPSEKDNE